MATQEHDQWSYLIIWEFRVLAGMEARLKRRTGQGEIGHDSLLEMKGMSEQS